MPASFDGLNPFDAARLLAPLGWLSFLDSTTSGSWSYSAAAPVARIEVREGIAFVNGERQQAAPLAVLRTLLVHHTRPHDPNGPPFQGGLIGFMSYEAARLFEPLPNMPRLHEDWPEMAFGLYDTVLAFDHEKGKIYLTGPQAQNWQILLQGSPPPLPSFSPLVWRTTETRSSYEAKLGKIIDYIRAGDIFQANLSQRFEARGTLDPLALYSLLRQANPAPYASFLDFAPRFVASTSPEQFLTLRSGKVLTSPIKGTKRRSPDRQEDERIAQALLASEKDRAENIMIVDLLRNDLSRVALPESVSVRQLCALERYASVHHLVSSVSAELAASCDAFDLLAATFPGGSITGAPKIRAMEIIAELEGEARGVYCGAIGWIGFNGDMDMAIPIRTLTGIEDRLSLRSGGGVTLLSDPAEEYEETLTKAQNLIRATGCL